MKWLRRILGWGIGGLLVVAGGVWVIGWALPVEHSVTVSAEMSGTPEAVWQVLTEVEAYGTWRPDVRDVEMQPSDASAPVWRERTAEGTVTYRQVAADPPRQLVVEMADEGLPYGGRWTYRLERVAERTRVTIREDGEVYSPLFRFFSRFVFGHDAAARSFLSALEARMERPAAAGVEGTEAGGRSERRHGSAT